MWIERLIAIHRSFSEVAGVIFTIFIIACNIINMDVVEEQILALMVDVANLGVDLWGTSAFVTSLALFQHVYFVKDVELKLIWVFRSLGLIDFNIELTLL
jgi:hypothetical protein